MTEDHLVRQVDRHESTLSSHIGHLAQLEVRMTAQEESSKVFASKLEETDRRSGERHDDLRKHVDQKFDALNYGLNTKLGEIEKMITANKLSALLMKERGRTVGFIVTVMSALIAMAVGAAKLISMAWSAIKGFGAG